MRLLDVGEAGGIIRASVSIFLHVARTGHQSVVEFSSRGSENDCRNDITKKVDACVREHYNVTTSRSRARFRRHLRIIMQF